MRIDDLIITIAYFSIPLQLVAALSFYPRLWNMPLQIILIIVLFALFVLCCGVGHLMRCIHYTNEQVYEIVNWVTAIVSLTTALVLFPMVLTIMSELDQGLKLLEQKLLVKKPKVAAVSKDDGLNADETLMNLKA